MTYVNVYSAFHENREQDLIIFPFIFNELKAHASRPQHNCQSLS